MSDTTVLKANERTEFGKGAARRVRRAGEIPAVIYGHGVDPVHITLPGHDTALAVRNSNALIEVDVAGGKKYLTIVKQIQRDVIKGFVEHLDLIIVRRGEKVSVEIPVHVIGEAEPDTMVNLDLPTLTVMAEATHIPEQIEISVDGMDVGDQLTAADLKLPKGVTIDVDPETLVIAVSAPPTVELESTDEEVEEPATVGDEEEAEEE